MNVLRVIFAQRTFVRSVAHPIPLHSPGCGVGSNTFDPYGSYARCTRVDHTCQVAVGEGRGIRIHPFGIAIWDERMPDASTPLHAERS